MNRFLLLFVAIVYMQAGYAQNLQPGGVSGAIFWNVSEKTGADQALWKTRLSNVSDTSQIIIGKNRTINQNPGLYLNAGLSTMTKSLNLGEIDAFSLFTVCQETDTATEQAIFSVESDTAADMVLTNRRLAALSTYKYASYAANKQNSPRIYSYFQNKSTDSALLTRRLRLGQVPRTRNVPASAFKGVVPEIVLFNRFISYRERRRVESYLALKYGISLSQAYPVSYVNSLGQVIWNADLNAAYSKNIAGIGRDDLSGLNQQISESVQTPEILKISHTGNLTNNRFVIWGDNGGLLRFPEQTGTPRRLAREWKIATYGTQGTTVRTEMNTLRFNDIDLLNAGETYWMMVDRSGTGSYPFGKVTYIKSRSLETAVKTIYFDTVPIDPDSSGYDVFTVIAAPELFLRTVAVAANCLTGTPGAIQAEIVGGSAPYTIVLQGITNTHFTETATVSGLQYVFANLPQGAYTIGITDAAQKTYSQKVWVSNSHSWDAPVGGTYQIKDGETLVLDASLGMPALNFTYSWENPDGTVSLGEKISITQSGTYVLSITDDLGCCSTIEFTVQTTKTSSIKKVQLYPNPSTCGWFTVRVSLYETADVEITIADMNGKVVQRTSLHDNPYYSYTATIGKAGVYLIAITTASEKQTLKLVVQ